MLRSPAAFLRQAQPIVVGAASSSTSGAAQATCSGAGASGRLLSSLARHSASPRSSQLIGASGHSSALSQLNSSPAWRRNASTDSERPFGSRISDDFDPRLVNYFRLAIYAGVASVLAAYLLDTRAAFHRLVTMPLVHRLVDPEDAHRWAVELGKMGAVPREKVAIDDETLEIEVNLGVARCFQGREAHGHHLLISFLASWSRTRLVSPLGSTKMPNVSTLC